MLTRKKKTGRMVQTPIPLSRTTLVNDFHIVFFPQFHDMDNRLITMSTAQHNAIRTIDHSRRRSAWISLSQTDSKNPNSRYCCAITCQSGYTWSTSTKNIPFFSSLYQPRKILFCFLIHCICFRGRKFFFCLFLKRRGKKILEMKKGKERHGACWRARIFGLNWKKRNICELVVQLSSEPLGESEPATLFMIDDEVLGIGGGGDWGNWKLWWKEGGVVEW